MDRLMSLGHVFGGLGQTGSPWQGRGPYTAVPT